MNDESKAEALYATLVWIALCIVLVTMPTWLTMIEDAVQDRAKCVRVRL